MPHFNSESALAAWLAEQGIDVAGWGTSGTKTVSDLWQEYERGEIAFQEVPPTRLVRVVQVILRRGEKILTEIAQEFADGRVRTRERAPSEKMAPGETVIAAAERCLREELGLDREAFTICKPSSAAREVVADSPSYPGLQTRYLVFSVEAQADALPASDFWCDNSAAWKGGDPVKRHLWGWR